MCHYLVSKRGIADAPCWRGWSQDSEPEVPTGEPSAEASISAHIQLTTPASRSVLPVFSLLELGVRDFGALGL